VIVLFQFYSNISSVTDILFIRSNRVANIVVHKMKKVSDC